MHPIWSYIPDAGLSKTTGSSTSQFVTQTTIRNIMKSRYSLQSLSDVGTLFSEMFPKSTSAKKLSCGGWGEMCVYLSNFGISPYMKALMRNTVNDSSGYVLLF